MLNTKQTDAGITKYYSLKPTSFHDLIRFELMTDSNLEAQGATLVVELASKEAANRSLLRLTFSGVSELKYIPGYWSFAFIDVVPIQRQWENIRYHAYETEQDTAFSLLCCSFEAEIVTAT